MRGPREGQGGGCRPRGWLAWVRILLMAGCGVLAGAAPAAQSVGGVRVMDESTEEGLRLSVRNANLAAVTLTIHVIGDNAVADRRMPVVVTCRGKGVFPFTELRPVQAGRSFSYRVKYDWQFGTTEAKHDRRTIYELPFASGGRHAVRQGFRGTFTHTGNNEYAVDFEMPVGTPVHAARAGRVEVVVDRFGEGGLDPRLRDEVNLVLIRHPDGTYGEYVHLRQGGVRVQPGQTVKARELLGYSGNSGYTQGPHLHFAVFRAVDGSQRETFPIRFRAREGASVEPREGESYTAP